jgi:hypothetical protein
MLSMSGRFGLLPAAIEVYLLNRVHQRTPALRREARMRPAALFSGLFLLLVAVAHLMRLLLRVELVVDGIVLPMWPSVAAVIGPAALALWLWRDVLRSEQPG